MSQGNIIKEKEKKIKGLSKEELKKHAIKAYKELEDALNGELQMLFLMSNIGMAIGTVDDGELSKEEKEFIDDVYPKVFDINRLPDGMDTIYNGFKKGAGKAEFEGIKMVLSGYPDAAMPLLDFILCFAYCDSKLDEKTSKELEDIFGLYLLSDFFKKGQFDEEEKDNSKEQKKKPTKETDAENKKLRESLLDEFKNIKKIEAEDRISEKKKNLELEIDVQEAKVTRYKETIAKFEEELENLGMFKFSRKKFLVGAIEQNEELLAKANEIIQDKRDELERLIESQEDKIEEAVKAKEEELKRKYPLSTEK